MKFLKSLTWFSILWLVLVSPSSAVNWTITKVGTAIPKPAGMSSKGPYFPVIRNMTGVTNFPYDYAVYCGTDHDLGAGGIWMFVTNDPTATANYISYDTAEANGDFDYLGGGRPTGNPIYVDSTGDQTETPDMQVIGGTCYLTYHNQTIPGSSAEQCTCIATSTNGVIFTRVGILLDTTGEGFPSDGHTGYFHWSLNPFTDQPFDYIGTSLWWGPPGNGAGGLNAVHGTDDPTDWNFITKLEHMREASLGNNFVVKWSYVDLESVQNMGNGEFCVLGTCGELIAGGAANANDLYELFVEGDGYTLTRQPRLVLARGGAGAADEGAAWQPTSVVHGGTRCILYTGSNAAGTANAIMLATGTFNASSAKPTKRTRPNYDQLSVDFRGLGSIPAWLTTETAGGGGTPTLSAAGLTLDGGAAGAISGIRATTAITPSTANFIEWMVKSVYAPALSTGRVPRFQITDTGPGTGANGSIGLTFGSTSPVGEFQLIERAGAASTATKESAYEWGYGDGVVQQRMDLGLRYEPANNVVHSTGSTEQEFDRVAMANVNEATAVSPRISVTDGDLIIEQAILRTGNASGTARPSINDTDVGSNFADIDFDKDVICYDGFTLELNGTPSTHTPSRVDSDTVRLTMNSGTITGADDVHIDYSKSSGDVRSETLVELDDVSNLQVQDGVAPSTKRQTLIIGSLKYPTRYPIQFSEN